MTTALVLSAGGMWAAWEVGVWKVLRDHFQPDLIVGASAGAWVGWAIAGGVTPHELAREWLDPRTGTIMRLGMHRCGVFRSDALVAKAHDLFDRSQPKIPFGLTIVEVPSLKLRLVRDREISWRHLAASASIPFGFPPVEIDGKHYVDGGFRGALPLWAAAEMGATRVIALNVLNTPVFRALHKIMRFRPPAKPMEIRTLEPSEPLGSLRDAVVWQPAKIARWMALGEQDAKRALTSITM